MADAADLNSAAVQAACGFEPHPRHQNGFVDGLRRFPLDQPRDPIGHASDTSPGGRRCGLTNAPLLGMLQSGRWLCPPRRSPFHASARGRITDFGWSAWRGDRNLAGCVRTGRAEATASSVGVGVVLERVSIGVGKGVSALVADQENETQVSSTTRSTDSWLNRRLYSSDTSSIRRIEPLPGGARTTSSLERSCWISPSESRHCP